jgi:hypothetical protein
MALLFPPLLVVLAAVPKTLVFLLERAEQPAKEMLAAVLMEHPIQALVAVGLGLLEVLAAVPLRALAALEWFPQLLGHLLLTRAAAAADMVLEQAALAAMEVAAVARPMGPEGLGATPLPLMVVLEVQILAAVAALRALVRPGLALVAPVLSSYQFQLHFIPAPQLVRPPLPHLALTPF